MTAANQKIAASLAKLNTITERKKELVNLKINTKDRHALLDEASRIYQLRANRKASKYVSEMRAPVLRWIKFENKAAADLRSMYPYRVTDSGWAGGALVIRVKIGKIESSFDAGSVKVWSRNGKWSGTNTIARLFLNHADTWTVIGGLLTIYKRADEKALVKECTWYEQSRGFSVIEKKGWLVGGYHTEAATKDDAISKARRARTNILRKDDAVLTIDSVHKKFGFCETGIRNFMQVNGIGERNEITVKELRAVIIANRALNCRSYRQHLQKMGIHLNCK